VYASYNLGKLHFLRGEHPQAEQHLRAALERKPEFPEAHVVLASVQDARGDYQAAAASLETALHQRPQYAGAWQNYATALVKLDRMADAESAARHAVSCDPEFLAAYLFLGDLLRTDGRLDEAVQMFQRARALPGGGIACEQAELHVLNHSDSISDEALFERHREVGHRLEILHPPRFATFDNVPDPQRRLRIGYVSRDFVRHPVGWFMAPVLERHDRSLFEVHCYATSARADDVTTQLRSAADGWLDASRMSHAEIADSIHRDRIDILVDLQGHAATSDLAVFAQQAAPVQVSWLGYLNTTGLTRIQYRICDAITDPPGAADRLHTEALVRLPQGQWCYRPYRAGEFSKTHAVEPPCRRNRCITFGSFNHLLKLSATAIGLWARILQLLQDSRLIVMGVPAGPAQDRLCDAFTQLGISASRIRMVPPVPMEEYFPWFNEVDLALDSTPYSGGTTTCDTLWMGVPVVTLAGSRSASRSAASLLSSLGLTEWIAGTGDDYVALALKFARHEALLTGLRATLRDRMRVSPLMDERRFARALEDAYRGMWRTWCAEQQRHRVA